MVNACEALEKAHFQYALRNIHAPFEAKMAQKAHGTCVHAFERHGFLHRKAAARLMMRLFTAFPVIRSSPHRCSSIHAR
ncbi:MAG: hypothetical protein ACRCV9_11790 [Burkholderiaceae bacterium]